MHDVVVALLWEVAWLASALGLLPLLRWVSADDRLANALAFSMGPALIVLPVWWLGTLAVVPFTRVTILGCFVALAIASWTLVLVRQVLHSALASTLRSFGSLSLLHVGTFAGYAFFRSFTPDIRYTEKPMELAFLSASIVTRQLPPHDPWFAGSTINYYVYGFIEMASIAKVLGVRPEVAFNLALATLFASTLTGVFAVTQRLAAATGGSQRRQAVAGVLTLLFLVGAGNWDTAWRLIRDPSAMLAASWWAGPGWNASRVIVDSGFPWGGEPRPTINEFPAFSFILADLHPHLLALPILVGYLAGLCATVLTPRPLAAGIVTGIALGTLWITNTWGVPLAVLVAALVLVVGVRFRGRCLIETGAAIAVPAVIVALPFQMTYVPSYGLAANELPAFVADLPVVSWVLRTVGFVIWERSSFGELIRAYGTLLCPGFLVLGHAVASLPEATRPRSGFLFGSAGFLLVLALASRTPALLVFGLLLSGLALVLHGDPRLSAGMRIALAILGATWLALLGIEFVFLRDVFGDRMNTVFKVSFDAWCYQAIALPVALVGLQVRGRLFPAVVAGTILALGIGMAYVPLSAWKWTAGFTEVRGLDGMRYIASTQPDEYAAIAWLREQAPPEAVILEAPGCSYGSVGDLPHNRVSMMTGRSTVIGWDGHEYQWRRGDPSALQELEQRQQAVRSVFADSDTATVAAVLARYHVRYVYIGLLERSGLGSACRLLEQPNPERLEAVLSELGWRPVYQRGTVTIYAAPAVLPIR